MRVNPIQSIYKFYMRFGRKTVKKKIQWKTKDKKRLVDIWA